MAGVLVALVSVAYVAPAITTAVGRPVAPLDDTYITLQYARQIARGQPYRYNDGDPPTTGMTSPLYGFLMAGVYLAGLRDELLVGFAVGMGVIWLALNVWLTYRLAARLVAAPPWPSLAALLVALTGAVQWGCFNGMETGFFTALTLAALDAFIDRRFAWCALWAGLAGLTRPEGQILAGLMGLTFLADHILRRRSSGWKRPVLLLATAVVVGSVPGLVNWTLTGTASAAGLQAKSWFLNVPALPADIIRSIGISYRRLILGRFMGWGRFGEWFVPPGLLLLMILGWIEMGHRRAWGTVILTLLWFFGGSLAMATLITALWHLGRYQVPFIPMGIVVATFGLAHLWRRFRHWWVRGVLVTVVVVMVATSTYSSVHFVDLYRRAVSTVVRQQLTVADWLRENLPSDARVGVHDTGSLRYVGQRPTYDLVGLTTGDAAIAWRHGAGSVYELMEDSPMRPDYFAIYPDVFSIPYLAATDLFAQELFRVDVPDHVVASAGPVQGVWRADWRLAGSGARIYQPNVLRRTAGLTLVDTLDVADLADESAHDLTWWHEASRPGFPTEVHQLAYRVLPEQEVLDGGRLVTGGMSFDVATRPGEPLWLVARLHAREAGAVQVAVDGLQIGEWAYPPVPGQWLETVFRVPATAVNGERTSITLQASSEDPGFRHYAPYYVWFLQGDPETDPVEIDRRVEVAFEGGISLVGFDSSGEIWHPGEVVPITLYWQVAQPVQSDAKVFLHLYDAEGNLGPQSDGWAYRGTRPPYTWWPHEIVVDPRTLPLPADVAPGRYTVEVGLYTPADGTRLEADVNGSRQPEGRVVLTTVVVDQ
jgi:hypothetical protein